MVFSISDIPQADRLDKVVQAVQAINNGATSDTAIAAAIGFTDRQGRYYRHATEILGFITNDRNNAKIQELGSELVLAPNSAVTPILRKAIYGNKFFRTLISHLEKQKDGLSETDIASYIMSITEATAHSTIPRRVKTILSWLLNLNILVENEDLYLVNPNTHSLTSESNILLDDHYPINGNKTLQEISVQNISPNPHNPRLIFEPLELNELKNSISKVGILVPLTVYRNTKSYPKTEYVILDGERRWRCAQELGIEEVPVNVIDEPKDITQNILFMFNIHHFRKEWSLFPTALKLEVIIEKIGTDQESILSEFTGVSRSTIRRCKTLLWYPTKYRDILLEKSGKISTDFFIELYPIIHRLSHEEKFSYPVGVEYFMDRCMDKFKAQKHVSDVKEFREMRKSMGYYEKSGTFNEFINKVIQFVDSNDVGLEIFSSIDIEEETNRKNIIRYLSYLNANLETINPDIISDFYIEDQLRSLNRRILSILESID